MASVLAGSVAGLVVLLLGLLIAVKPGLYLKFAKWQLKTIWAADLRTTAGTEKRMRGLGLLVFLIGAVILYAVYFVG